MTNVLPDRETRTRPIAHRWLTTTTTYDPDATAIIRPNERLILADPNTSGEIVPLGHLFAYTTAPAAPPPIPQPQPSPNPQPKPSNSRPSGYSGRRRDPAEPVPVMPPWIHAAGYAGTLLLGVMTGASGMFLVLSASGHVW